MFRVISLFLFGASPSPTLLPDKSQAASDDPIHATLSAPLPAGAAIPACGALTVERYDDAATRWIADPPRECTKSVAAVPWTADTALVTSVVTDRFAIARLVLVYGIGCTPGLPLELAGCQRLEAIHSANISIQPRKGR